MICNFFFNKNIPIKEMDDDKILVGSNAFFKNMEGFKSKDKDYLALVENPTDFKDRKEVRLRGIDYFYYRLDTPKNMIDATLRYGDPMLIVKFLVPKVIKTLNLTVEDLERLEPLVEKLDEEHQYQKVIYDSYIKSRSFALTEETLEKAYESYRASRNMQ